MRTFHSLRRHPGREVLLEWLTGGGSPVVDQHLATCQRCATELERLDADTPAEVDPSTTLGAALTEALAPPADFNQRMERKVTDKVNSRQLFDIATDLFGAGLETTRLLFTEEPDDDN